MKYLAGILIAFSLFLLSAKAQAQFLGIGKEKEDKEKKERRKFYQSSRGPLVGYERGRNDFFHLGYEYNWKKIRLKKPVIRAVDGFMEYNFWENVLGLKVAYWQRHGRAKFTYGGHAGYFSNFDKASLSVGPSIGFRILGFHGQAGYNFLLNDPEREIAANRLYLSVNFFIPYHSKLFFRKGDKKKNILKW